MEFEGYQEKKMKVTKVISGLNLLIEGTQVCTSKSRCIVAFVGGGKQILLSQNELIANYRNGDGTRIKENGLRSGQIYTVYSV